MRPRPLAVTGPIGYTRAVNTWFEKGRGLSLGLTLTGVSLVAALSAPLLNFVITHHGWRGGFRPMAAWRRRWPKRCASRC